MLSGSLQFANRSIFPLAEGLFIWSELPILRSPMMALACVIYFQEGSILLLRGNIFTYCVVELCLLLIQ